MRLLARLFEPQVIARGHGLQDGDRWLQVRDKAGQESRHDAGTVLWTAGVEAPAVAEALARGHRRRA